MTPSAQNEAIAKACGWTVEHRPTAKFDAFPFYLVHPSGNKSCGWRTLESAWSHGIPNYTVSLDACAKMEKTLKADEQYTYGMILARMTIAQDFDEAKFRPNGFAYFAVATASPERKCKAFLETKNLWHPAQASTQGGKTE